MKRKLQVLAAICFSIMMTCTMAYIANSRVNNTASYKDHVAQNDCRDWGTTVLSNEATTTVTTRCKIVESCQVGLNDNSGATASTNIICNIPTQTSTNAGVMYVRADTIGGTTSGSTTVSYGVDGYGRK